MNAVLCPDTCLPYNFRIAPDNQIRISDPCFPFRKGAGPHQNLCGNKQNRIQTAAAQEPVRNANRFPQGIVRQIHPR